MVDNSHPTMKYITLHDLFAAVVLAGRLSQGPRTYGTCLWRHKVTGQEGYFDVDKNPDANKWELIKNVNECLADYCWDKADALMKARRERR